MFCYDIGIDIEIVKNSFLEIYLIFRFYINIVMFGNEVLNIQEKLKQIGDIFIWIGFYRIIDLDKLVGEIDLRNFFVYSGFERNVIEVRIENDRVLVRYSLNVNFNDINCWLKRRFEQNFK